MIKINIITNDNKVHEFGVVNQKTIYDQIKSVDVLNDDKLIHQYEFKQDEYPLIRKRTNSDLGELYIIGYHKGGEQKLILISPEGKIIDHEEDCGCKHVFHGEVEIQEHEK